MIREEKRMDEEWVEEITKLFREMVNFYRMEYSQPLIRLFNEFAFLLLCWLYSREEAFTESELRKLPSAMLADIVKGLGYAQSEEKELVALWQEHGLERYRTFIYKGAVLRPLLLAASRLAERAAGWRQDAGLDGPRRDEWRRNLYGMLCRLLELCAGDKSEKGRYLLREQEAGWLLRLIEEDKEEAGMILDPQCGAAAMLDAAGRQFGRMSLYGMEEDEDWYRAACFLGHFSNFPISLRKESMEEAYMRPDRPKDRYDLVVTNPVFNNTPVAERGGAPLLLFPVDGIRSRYHYQIVGSLSAVRKEGKALLFVPDSFLFASKNESVRVRKWMLDEFAVDGVILLPESAFMGNMTVKASLLVVENPLMAGGWEDSHTQRIFFYDLRGQAERRDGKAYDALLACWDKRQAYYEEWQELLAAGGQENYNGVRTPEKWEHTDCWFAGIEEIRKAGGTLLPDYYRPAGRQEIHFAPPEELLREMIDMQERIAEEMRALLTEVEGL